MSAFNIEVEGGKSVKLPTAGKYCDRDIVVSAKADGGSYDEGYADGEKAEHARFWDVYQQNGNRTDYQTSFSGEGWTAESFRPKYNIAPQSAYMMFRNSRIEVDLPALLTSLGVTMNTSKCINFQYAFFGSRFTRLGEINVTGIGAAVPLSNTFESCSYLHTIDKVVCVEQNRFAANTFASCKVLENITFDGTIGASISFAQSPALSADSVQSIIDALKDLTGQTAQTLTFHATVGGNLTDEQKTAITAKNWTLVY